MIRRSSRHDLSLSNSNVFFLRLSLALPSALISLRPLTSPLYAVSGFEANNLCDFPNKMSQNGGVRPHQGPDS